MARSTARYRLTSLEAGDVWYPSIDRSNQEVIDRLLSATEFFVSSGVVAVSSVALLSDSSEATRRAYYEAAFDYSDALFFTVANNECQFISNEDTVVDLVATSNVAVSSMMSATFDGALVSPGHTVFLTAQTTTSQNGVYDVGANGAVRMALQPKKVFVRPSSANYGYGIWAYQDNSADRASQYLYDCILAIEGLIAIQGGKVVSPSATCYLRPGSSGAKNLLVFSPDRYYATGTPILFVSDEVGLQDVSLATFTSTATGFDRFYSVSSLVSVASTEMLTDFSNTTNESRDSLKSLHIHEPTKSKLKLSDVIKLTLVPDTDVSGAFVAFDQAGEEYTFSAQEQAIVALYLNGKEVSGALVSYNSSSSRFSISVPGSKGDHIVLLATASLHRFLVPLSSEVPGQSEFVLEGSAGSSGYVWNTSDFDNYQLSSSGSSFSQRSYAVDSTTGTVTLESSGPDNIPVTSEVLQSTRLDISSSRLDTSSFYGSTQDVRSVAATDVAGRVSHYRGRHFKFAADAPVTSPRLLPLQAVSGEEYVIPYLSNGVFSRVAYTSSIDSAVCTLDFTVVAVDGSLAVITNGRFFKVYEGLNDKYVLLSVLKRTRNTDNGFLALLTDDNGRYCVCVADLDKSVFDFHEFVSTVVINDIAGAVIDGETKVFIATVDDILEADFSKIEPRFSSVYYSLNDGTSSVYSYIRSNASQIDVSVLPSASGDEYELYAVVDGFPSGSQTIAALRRRQVVMQGSPLKVYAIGDNGGVSDNGIVAIGPSGTLVSTSPVSASMFPLAYGSNIQVSAADIVCKTGTVSDIGSFASGSLSALDHTVLSIGDYLLIRAQVLASENGVYRVTHVGADFFSASKQALDNLAIGNFVKLQSGPRYASSYWEIESTSPLSGSEQVYFRLRATNLGTNLTGVDAVFSPSDNTVVLSSPTFTHVVYDSTGLVKDDYRHQSLQVTQPRQILAADGRSNLVVTSTGLLSDDKSHHADSAVSFVSYVPPLAQGDTIQVLDLPGLQWPINQRVSMTDGQASLTATVVAATSGSFSLQVTNTTSGFIGQAKLQSNCFTFRRLANNAAFDALWWGDIAYNTPSGPISILKSGPEYRLDVAAHRIVLATGSAYANHILYGLWNPGSVNLRPHPAKVFDPEANRVAQDFHGRTIGTYLDTTIEPYTLEHSSHAMTTSPLAPVLVSKTDPGATLNLDAYAGPISSPVGDAYAEVVSGSATPTTSFLTGGALMTKAPRASYSIEDSLLLGGPQSAQTTNNSMALDGSLAAALAGYERFASGSDTVAFTIDPAVPASIQHNASDYEPGLSNYTHLIGALDHLTSVEQVFAFNGGVLGISMGVLFVVSATGHPHRMPLAKMDFSHCYSVHASDSYIYLGTDKGLYVLDSEYSVVSQSCTGHRVTKVFEITPSGMLVYAVENTVVAIDTATAQTASVKLDCGLINDIAQIDIDSPRLTKSYLLVATDSGLFALTHEKDSSSQSFEFDSGGFLAGNKIALGQDSYRIKASANKNNMSFIYDSLAGLMAEEKGTDGWGQPYISHIEIDGARTLLFTDNGILEYNTLFSLDMHTAGAWAGSVATSGNIVGGVACLGAKVVYDSTNDLEYSLVFTSGGLYATFDRYRTLIKTNLVPRALSGVYHSGSWYVGADTGLFTTNDVGASFESITVPKGFVVDHASPLYSVVSPVMPLAIVQVTAPVYFASSGPHTLHLKVYGVNKDTGRPSGSAVVSATKTDTYGIGRHLVKFAVSPYSAIAGAGYSLEFSSPTGSPAIFSLSNASEVELSSTRSFQSSGSSTLAPSVKLCSGTSAGLLSVRRPLLTSDLAHFANIRAVSGSSLSVFSTAEVNIVVDNSQSYLDKAGSVANIDSFLSMVKSRLDSKFDTAFYNVVFTDKGMTGFTGPLSTTVPAFTGPIAQRSRVIDAINAGLSRSSPGRFAPSALGSGPAYANYISPLSNSQRSIVFKGVLDSFRDIEYASIKFAFDASLEAGVSYDLCQSGRALDVNLHPSASPNTYKKYVFVKDQFIAPADYTMSDNNIVLSSIGSGNKLSDLRVYFSSTLPILSDLGGLQSSGSAFAGAWSAWLSSHQSKVLVVLSDYIDNYSFTDYSDFEGLLEDSGNNQLLVLCGSSMVDPLPSDKVAHKAVSVIQGEGETFANYVSRTSSVMANLVHPAFSGVLDVSVDGSVRSITVTFSSLSVYCDVRDSLTGGLVSIGALQSGVPFAVGQAGTGKDVRIYFTGAGSVTSIVADHEYDTEYLLTNSYARHFLYQGHRYGLDVSTGIGSGKVNLANIGPVRFVQDFSSSFSLGTSTAPPWTPQGAGYLATGPALTFGMTKIGSDLQGYDKYSITSQAGSRMPPVASFSGLESTGSSWHAINAVITRSLDSSNTTAEEMSQILGSLINDLKAEGSLSLTQGMLVDVWWDWARTYNKGKYSYESLAQALTQPLVASSAAYAVSMPTGPNLDARMSLGELACLKDDYSSTVSMASSIVPGSLMAEYLHRSFAVRSDEGTVFKLIPTLETVEGVSSSPVSSIFGIGSSKTGTTKIEGKIFKLDAGAGTKVARPTVPRPSPVDLRVARFKSKNLEITGYYGGFSGAGRKVRYIDSSIWSTTTGSSLSPAMYGVPIAQTTGLNVTAKNTAGQSGSIDISDFSGFDENFSASILAVTTMVNEAVSNSVVAGDVVSTVIVVGRNDGFATSKYTYGFNVGDQVSVSSSWYAVSSRGSKPVLVSSSPELEITSQLASVFAGGYVYVAVAASRDLTKGDIRLSAPVWLS